MYENKMLDKYGQTIDESLFTERIQGMNSERFENTIHSESRSLENQIAWLKKGKYQNDNIIRN